MKTIVEKQLDSVVWVDAERMGGVACFFGTRVPVEFLFDYLAKGKDIASFRDDYPGVKPEQIESLLMWSKLAVCRETGALETFTG
jgi:uncharacterized protein (DUF433 family)